MTRSEVVLAILAAGGGRAFSPAQLQKAAFLVTRNAPEVFDQGHTFHFEPYDYGPFDSAVYQQATALKAAGSVDISPSAWGRWVMYSATDEGIARGQQLLAHLPDAVREYVSNVSQWVLRQSFTSLVKSIYAQYPEMRANSIFKD
jgi:hypothetical protein